MIRTVLTLIVCGVYLVCKYSDAMCLFLMVNLCWKNGNMTFLLRSCVGIYAMEYPKCWNHVYGFLSTQVPIFLHSSAHFSALNFATELLLPQGPLLGQADPSFVSRSFTVEPKSEPLTYSVRWSWANFALLFCDALLTASPLCSYSSCIKYKYTCFCVLHRRHTRLSIRNCNIW
jgi:hypothetical protein